MTLLEAIQTGDAYRYARAIVRDDESAADVVQDAFLRYGNSNPVRWEHQIRCVARDAVRKFARRQRMFSAHVESLKTPQRKNGKPLSQEPIDAPPTVNPRLDAISDVAPDILDAFRKGGNIVAAAELLGVSERTLSYRIAAIREKFSE